MPIPPAEVPRPALALWLWKRNINWREAGEALLVHPETVRCWCLPFSDPDWRRPQTGSVERIFRWTQGAVGPADFHPPMQVDPDGSTASQPAGVA